MIRIGQGYDVHQLVHGRPLILGGLEIPGDLGLLGHSDADVLLHAITDAILGAVAAGDIGQWFPPSDDRYKDACSADLLRAVAESPQLAAWTVVNVDATVMAEAPKLAPYLPEMREKIAAILGVGTDAVSVKATTTEGLGAIGRGEGMAALAVVLMESRASAG